MYVRLVSAAAVAMASSLLAMPTAIYKLPKAQIACLLTNTKVLRPAMSINSGTVREQALVVRPQMRIKTTLALTDADRNKPVINTRIRRLRTRNCVR